MVLILGNIEMYLSERVIDFKVELNAVIVFLFLMLLGIQKSDINIKILIQEGEIL